MKLLYINGNPQEEDQSYGQKVARHIIDNFDGESEQVNVYTDDIPLIDKDVLDGWGELRKGLSLDEINPNSRVKIARMNQVLEQFLEADVYVLVTPLWNLSTTPMMKAYVDNVTIAGKTFKYGEKGPVGLLKNKKAIIIQASGGIYSTEEARKYDFGINYLDKALSFIGVDDIHRVYVEGTAMNLMSKQELIDKAKDEVDIILKKLKA